MVVPLALLGTVAALIMRDFDNNVAALPVMEAAG
jgi:hypothetical protein